MASITQAPTQLNLSGVSGNPFSLVVDATFTDANNNPIPWADITNATVVVNRRLTPRSDMTPTITSPQSGQWSIEWTATQMAALYALSPCDWVLSCEVSGAGPFALLAGTLAAGDPTTPGSATTSTASLSVAVGTSTATVSVQMGGVAGVTTLSAADSTITVGGTASAPTVKVTAGTFDASGAAATAQTNAEGYADSQVSAETSRAEAAEAQRILYRGAWQANTAYAVNDQVTEGGNVYVCTTAHTSGATFSGADWTNLTAGQPTSFPSALDPSGPPAILALEAKVGVDGSAVTTSLDYKVGRLALGPGGVPPIWFDPQSGGMNLNIGAPNGFTQIQEPTAYSNVAVGGGWRNGIPQTGNLALVTSGFNNTAMGDDVLTSLTTGNGNSGYGADAMSALVSGTFNSGYGEGALEALVSGGANAAFGSGALNSQLGSGSTAVGANAGLKFNGSNAIFVGVNAGQQIPGGTSVLVIGANSADTAAVSLTSVTIVGSGSFNSGGVTTSASSIVGIGDNVLNAVTTGNEITAVGSGAGVGLTSASAATLVGYGSGHALTSGASATMIGSLAGKAVSTAAGVTCLGAGAGNTSTTNNSYMTLLGYGTIGTGAGAVAIGVDSGGNPASAGANQIALGTPNHQVYVPGTLRIDTALASTATAGSATLPANPATFLPINLGGVNYKLAVYNV